MKTTHAATETLSKAYDCARDRYAAIGVDTEAALASLATIPISLQCWQGDDVAGLEGGGALDSGGLKATGNYPGRARNGDELRADMETALRLVPGKHRVNLHAIYAETGGRKVARDELTEEHFKRWVDWARAAGLGLDFNPTFFAHPMADSGFTLASLDEKVRAFWVRHGRACRRIAAHFGKALTSPCVTNVWIPDGYKDTPADRLAHRAALEKSLDEVFAETLDPRCIRDAVESKLFGIGSESYVVGSHEFYMGYAVKHQLLLCLDSGHFHPTESTADKISSLLLFVPELLLHVSRGVRWDSDHIVTLNDEVRAIAEEIVRAGALTRVHIGLDYFDASVNRVAAWVIGMRGMLKALLSALLQPADKLRAAEREGDFTSRLALMEELKSLPMGAVWDHYCRAHDVAVGLEWLDEVKSYEKTVLSRR